MIKQAYLRGLTKVAAYADLPMQPIIGQPFVNLPAHGRLAESVATPVVQAISSPRARAAIRSLMPDGAYAGARLAPKAVGGAKQVLNDLKQHATRGLNYLRDRFSR